MNHRKKWGEEKKKIKKIPKHEVVKYEHSTMLFPKLNENIIFQKKWKNTLFDLPPNKLQKFLLKEAGFSFSYFSLIIIITCNDLAWDRRACELERQYDSSLDRSLRCTTREVRRKNKRLLLHLYKNSINEDGEKIYDVTWIRFREQFRCIKSSFQTKVSNLF